MHEIIIDLISILIFVCGFILTKNIIPYLKNMVQKSEYANVYFMVEKAVKAAEKIYCKPKQGHAKKADVVAFASHWLESKGIHITEAELDKLIEAAVFSINDEGENENK